MYRVNKLLRLVPLKISPPDPRDSGLFPEKSGNPTDTSAAVSASTEFDSHVLVLGVRLTCTCVGNRSFILTKKCRSFYEIITLTGKIGTKSA